MTLISELEKRLARASRFGEPTEDIQAKLDRAHKFGVETEAVVAGMKGLDNGLSRNKRERAQKEKPKTDAEGAKEAGAEGQAKKAPAAGEAQPPKKAETVSTLSCGR